MTIPCRSRTPQQLVSAVSSVTSFFFFFFSRCIQSTPACLRFIPKKSSKEEEKVCRLGRFSFVFGPTFCVAPKLSEVSIYRVMPPGNLPRRVTIFASFAAPSSRWRLWEARPFFFNSFFPNKKKQFFFWRISIKRRNRILNY